MIKPDDFTDVTYAVEEDAFAVITINRPERYERVPRPHGRRADRRRSSTPGPTSAWPRSSSPAPATRRSAPVATSRSAPRPARTARPSGARSRSSGLHRIIRDIPKPVIAAVNGVAVGGGHVLHVLCDLTVAAEHARFGQSRARGSARSTPASARRTSPGWSARSGPARSGSCSTCTTRRPPSGGTWSTTSCRADQLLDKAREYARKIASLLTDGDQASSSTRSTPTPTTSAACRNVAFDGLDLFVESDEGQGGRPRVRREAAARLLAVPLSPAPSPTTCQNLNRL